MSGEPRGEGPASLIGAGLHKTNVGNERQVPLSQALMNSHPVFLHYMVNSRQLCE